MDFKELGKGMGKTFLLRLVIGIIVFIFIFFKYQFGGQAPVPKEDISRVESGTGLYTVNYQELVDLIKEVEPKAIIETSEKNEIYEDNGIKEFYKGIEVNHYLIECFSPEKDGKLSAVTIESLEGRGKGFTQDKSSKNGGLVPTEIEFENDKINDFKYYSSLLNNILNSSSSKKEFKEFLKARFPGNDIVAGEGMSGESNLYMGFTDNYSLVIEFVPKK